MKNIVVTAWVMLLSSSSMGAEVLVDRLAAEVNGEPVMHSEIMDKVEKGPLVEVAPFPAKETDAPYTIAMQDLINFKIIMQKAKELGIEAKPEEVEAEIEKFIGRKGITKADLLAGIAQQGLTYEQYKEDFASQYILSQFQGRVILPSVKVSEKDLEVYYMRTSGERLDDQVELTFRQIFIKFPADAAAPIIEAKRKLADKVYNELAAGMAFVEAAKVYSDADNASEGGLMPTLHLKDLSSDVRKTVEPVAEKGYSKPLETPSGIFIFYLEKKTLAVSEDYKKRKSELEYKLRQEEVAKQTMKWIEEQRAKSKINIIATSEK
jgi:peptidyl-prolyl cis-trans isomerase SurA